MTHRNLSRFLANAPMERIVAIASGGGYLGTVDLLDPVELLARGRL